MAAVSNKRPFLLGAVALIGGLACASGALAQVMSTNSASFNAGYGRISGQENRGVEYGTRDVSGNRIIIDGVIQTGADQSFFSRTSGVMDSGSGVGGWGGNATAIGNNLVVVTQGSYNTVIVTSVQTNNGDVTAGATTSGGDDD